jgi:glycyl-tRNA synthetase beta subunit
MMTEQEVRTAMKNHRWSYLPRSRKGHNYVYAQRKVDGKKTEKYICAYTALAQLTFGQLMEKLQIVVQPVKPSIAIQCDESSVSA